MMEGRSLLRSTLPLREAVDRLMQEAFVRPALPPPRLTADVYETADGDTYIVEVPVPGLQPNEITVSATSDMLTIETQPRKAEEARTYLQREQPTGPMSRVITFPTEIDTDNIRATLEHGLLRIEVPKAAVARPRTIPIQRVG
ncbi:MAG TPA: Hsp20/alpha crystallin family protein [Chloroflexota bacterium]|nr:Hsp20/alpha crystallin family protein [Chloroflexota bacterium]